MRLAYPRRLPFIGQGLAPASAVNWTYVQSSSTNASGASSLALAFGTALTRGNLIVVNGFAHTGGTIVTLSISDTKLFAYTQALDTGWNGTDNSRCTQWYTRVLSAGADTVTITPSSTPANLFLSIHEFSPGASPIGMTVSLDGTNSHLYTTNTGAPSAGSVAVTGAKDLAVCMGGLGNGTGAAIYTPGTGWTGSSSQSGSPWGYTEYQLNIGSAVTAQFSVDISSTWNILGTTYSAG